MTNNNVSSVLKKNAMLIVLVLVYIFFTITTSGQMFQPMNFNFGLLPHHEGLKKKNKKEILAERAERAVREWIAARNMA